MHVLSLGAYLHISSFILLKKYSIPKIYNVHELGFQKTNIGGKTKIEKTRNINSIDFIYSELNIMSGT